MKSPQNAVGLVRLSDLRADDLNEDGNSSNLDDQERRVKTCGTTIGWRITRVIVENDLVTRNGKTPGVSAFKRRKITLPDGRVELRTVRPGFRQALQLLATGQADGLIALDLDRAVRDPRDLEDLIDVVEQHKVPVQSVTGSLRLANDADVTMARVMVAVANKESRDKARRVAAARERQAAEGVFGGGQRRYGFEPDGVTVRRDEADIIAEMSERVVQGASLRSLAADLRKRQVPSASGAAWSAETLRSILTRPRNAGRMVYRGVEVGDAPWAPIVPVDTFRAMMTILRDPNRRVGPGAAPKWLGTNLYRCGVCDDGTGVHVRLGGRQPAYRCKAMNHLVRAVAHVDALVVGTIVARLALPDAASLFLPARPDVDVAGLRGEAAAIRTNLNQLAADMVLGVAGVDKAQLYAASAAAKTRLAAIDATLQAVTVDSPLAPLIGVEDVTAAWEALTLPQQRLVLDTMVTVTILPCARRGRGFDPGTVSIVWKQTAGSGQGRGRSRLAGNRDGG